MHSIRTKFTLLTVCALVVALSIATAIGVVSIRSLGSEDADEMLMLMCKSGEMNLDSYFEDVERSVKTVASLVQDSLDDDSEQLEEKVENARNLFTRVAYETNGVLTYYFRVNPEVSDTVEGFWYVNLDGEGFQEHEVTDITQYDTEDTSKLVWYTVPKAKQEGVWLPPYYTDNLDVRVISYNTPVYQDNELLGVIGIEIDYKTLVREVENIRLYDSGYAFVIDEKGEIIFHPEYDAASADKVALPEGLLSQESYVHYVHDNVEKAAVWLPLSNGMRLYVTVPMAEINSSWQSLIRSILRTSLLVLLVVTFFTMRFAGHLAKPLDDLTVAAKRVQDGDYDFELDYDKNDEVGILTRTFKQLADSVKDHISELDKRVYVDALTSVRNKGAYSIMIQELQETLDSTDTQLEFAIGVFDCDNLKTINDEYGHDKGDIYLQTASRLICKIFQHSPVFRIGGDEFAVILRNDDYLHRDELLDLFRKTREEICASAQNDWERVNVTLGLAVYDPTVDASVDDLARRADQLMYENKRRRKEGAKAIETV